MKWLPYKMRGQLLGPAPTRGRELKCALGRGLDIHTQPAPIRGRELKLVRADVSAIVGKRPPPYGGVN